MLSFNGSRVSTIFCLSHIHSRSFLLIYFQVSQFFLLLFPFCYWIHIVRLLFWFWWGEGTRWRGYFLNYKFPICFYFIFPIALPMLPILTFISRLKIIYLRTFIIVSIKSSIHCLLIFNPIVNILKKLNLVFFLVNHIFSPCMGVCAYLK